MAEYIERDEFLKRIKPYNTSDKTDKALYNFALNRMIETPTADVIEREEYEKLKQKNIELEIEYDDVMKMNALRVTEYKQLRSKIDEAIEEITNLRQQYPNEDYYDCKWEILEILKRNIGE